MIQDVSQVQHKIETKGYELVNKIIDTKMSIENRDDIMSK